MRYDFGLAWRNLRNRFVETAVPVLVIALAIALSVTVIVLADGAEEGIIQASDPFGVLVIGAAGSGQQLVLSSVLLQGNPIGNIDYAVYESLEADPRVQLAVPLAFGDSVGGARIIGTNHHFFELRSDRFSPPAFQLAEGRLFEAGDHEEDEHENAEHEEDEAHLLEAVLGSDAARHLGLTVGDQFQGTHGVGSGIAENLHEDVYTVVGILAPSGTAYDSAVYTTVETVWHVHEEESNNYRLDLEPVQVSPEAGAAAITDQVTSVLVLPTGFIEQNQIVQEFYVNPILQAAFPGQELGNLLGLLNQGQQVLNLVAYLVLGIAALTVFLSMYNAVIARQQSIAVMRSLGSRRANIFRIVLFETLIVSLLGAVIGRILGYVVAIVIAAVFSSQSAIPVPVRLFDEIAIFFGHIGAALNPAAVAPAVPLNDLNLLQFELLLWGISIVVGLLAGLIPAAMAYRVNVVEKLFPA